ncbi:RNA-binding protein [Helicobacter sp. MIT 14-3879]|uniref:RNA recognition motif domain-containing protein n=1 Tax=Helicobacter sp. MIT 14-3879 TaxID=2040649 RepID=UPI001C69BC9A|nr:RNA-binding protein [Helicobacter sp. MIT 14-3879]
MKSVYVGNMSYSATKEQISELFSKFGEVHSVKIILDKESRKPKGFCFVEMDDNNALNAIEGLNNAEFLGRNLKVNEAKNKN